MSMDTRQSPAHQVREWQGTLCTNVVRLGMVVLQLVLLLFLVHTFALESTAFLHLMVLAFGGFLVHHSLPLRFRLPFFACLSVGGIALVLGAVNCAWLVSLGGVLIGIAHLPVPFRWRVGVMLLATSVLVALRVELIEAPWSSSIWPILGSMFMFRMIIYMYDVGTKMVPTGVWWSLSYFFMLPNVCFAMFPVVDYKTFYRTHSREEARFETYQTGLWWMLRGLVHLILYRLIRQNFLISVADVDGAAAAAQFLVTTYLLYLYVSGSYHLVIGLMHLFGFNLPATHHNYLLASSFTDLWRRINIYWKNFIERIFFRPAYYRLSRYVAHTPAMVLATVHAIAATWILHSVQWFWIRGDFPITRRDVTFWSILGAFLVAGVLYEARRGRKRSLTGSKRTARSELALALRTCGMFAIMCLLWSLWSVASFDDFVAVAGELTNHTRSSALWIVTALAGLGVAKILIGRTMMEHVKLGVSAASERRSDRFWRPALSTSALCTVFLVIGTWPAILVHPTLVDAVFRLRDRYSLGTTDAETLQRGYYEKLTNVERFNPALESLYARRPERWTDWWRTDIWRVTEAYPYHLLVPSISTEFMGAVWSTNRWGMRDREYDKEKAPGTLRIAILGDSVAAGAGVDDGSSFECLAEDLLNERDTDGRIARFEILNFGVPNYGLLKVLATMQQRVLEFDPDVVIVAHTDDYHLLIRDLLLGGKLIKAPYEEVGHMLARTGLEPGAPRRVVERQFRQHRRELVRWINQKMAADCRARGVQFLGMFVPVPGSTLDAATRDEQMSLAREAGFELIDLSDAYGGVDPRELWVADWDRHPNAMAHRMLAEKAYAGLEFAIHDLK